MTTDTATDTGKRDMPRTITSDTEAAATEARELGPDEPAERRILILSASMGSGHEQVSHELQRRLSEHGHSVTVADFNELMLGPTGSWLSRLYPWLVNQAPRLYDRIYRTFFLAPQHAGERVLVPTLLATPGLRRLVADMRPHVVVSTFHLAGLAAARLRAREFLDCPAVTYITTFAVHNLWVHPQADEHLCISPAAAKEAARRSGRPATVTGPVVRAMFGRPPSDWKQTRAHLGLPTDGKLALVVAGSLGLGDVDETAAAIGRHSGWTPVVSCGHNEALRARIEESGHATALGWIEDMAALMDAADVLVDNAGGLSSKEALHRGLPVVTYRPISGHGRDDAVALERMGLTDVVEDESALLAKLDQLAPGSLEREARIQRSDALLGGDPTREIERLARAPAPAVPAAG